MPPPVAASGVYSRACTYSPRACGRERASARVYQPSPPPGTTLVLRAPCHSRRALISSFDPETTSASAAVLADPRSNLPPRQRFPSVANFTPLRGALRVRRLRSARFSMAREDMNFAPGKKREGFFLGVTPPPVFLSSLSFHFIYGRVVSKMLKDAFVYLTILYSIS